MWFTTRSPKLPTDVLPKADPRYQAAKEGDALIRIHRVFWKLAYPVAALIALLSCLFGRRASNWIMLAGVFASYYFMVMIRGSAPRVPWSRDFRPPILALRSHTDQRTKEGGEVPRGQYDHETGREPYLFQLSFNLWEWGRTLLLQQEEYANDLRVFGLVVSCSDADWTESVVRLATAAWVVVVFPSSTKGCITELKLLEKNNLLSKTIIFMPPKTKKWISWLNSLSSFRLLKEKNFANDWMQLSKELHEHGFNLPDYDQRGMLYIPDAKLAVVKCILLNYDSCPWRRLIELVPRSEVSSDSIWNIVNYGRAYECVGEKSQLGGYDATHHSLEPGMRVRYLQDGQIAYSLPIPRNKQS